MKRKFTLLSVLSLLLLNQVIFSQTTNDPRATVFSTVNSGSWATTAIWETFSTYAAAIAATPGTGTAATGVPSGTQNVLIRNGHTVTMGAANRACKSIIVQAGGKLWANEALPTARRLQVGQGGTGFVYPLTDTIQIDGVLGGANDALFIESGTAAKYINISGGGSIDIGRLRTIGGSGSGAGGIMELNIDANVNCWITGNYGFSIVYNPTTTDNYTCNIKPAKTVSLKTSSTVFHNSQNAATYGNYVYNIQGILDFAVVAGSSIIAPAPAASKITLNVDGGTMKVGTSFRADTSTSAPVSEGILDFRLVNGGVVDATATTSFVIRKTTDGAGGVRDLVFATDATSSVKVAVGATETRFPVGLTGSATPNTVRLTNSGTSDVFTVLLKSTIDNTPADATKVVNRQWTINETTAGSSIATVALSWVTADQAAGFSPAGTVSILRWTGTMYEPYSATVTGSGTANDPYVATTAVGVVMSFSPFIVANTTPVTAPVSFINTKAFAKGNGVQIEWTTAEESGIYHYAIEKSTDGSRFTQAGTIASVNRTAASYNWFDATPSAGINYYRIKAVEADGSKFTAIMKVTIGKKGAEMIIASNPVKGNVLSLQLSGMEKSTYTLSIFNTAGQQVFTKAIVLEGSSLSQNISLPQVGKGLFTVQLKGASSILTNKIIIE